MEDFDMIGEMLPRQIALNLKALAKAPNSAEKKVYSEIVHNLTQSLGFFRHDGYCG